MPTDAGIPPLSPDPVGLLILGGIVLLVLWFFLGGRGRKSAAATHQDDPPLRVERKIHLERRNRRRRGMK
jgi:hypothetical protein